MNIKNEIEKFLYPKSILLVGVSSKPKSIGYEILRSIIGYGFNGKIFITNPKANEILGIKCHKSILEINEQIDLAIILLPKNLVLESIKELNRINVKNVIIITAGFRETGNEGLKLEEEIIQFARANNIRIVGPNCMGVINSFYDVRFNATFVADVPKPSPISFLSQSGALAAAVLNTIKETDYTFGEFVSIGNKADLNENDFLEYWLENQRIKIISMYLESFSDGRKFVEITKKVTETKPVIVLKSARTESGSKAALSHTGALASQDDIVDTAFKYANITRVDTIEEMFETAKAFLYLPQSSGNKVAIITNAGGPAILCVDELEKVGLKLADLSQTTKSNLQNVVHPEGSLNNPIDLLPGADGDSYRKVVQIVSIDKSVDAIIAIFVEPVMVKAYDVIYQLTEEQKVNKKPIIITVFPLPEFWYEWKNKGIQDSLILKSVQLAPKVLKNFVNYYSNRNRPVTNYKSYIEDKDKQKINNIFSRYHNQFIKASELAKILKMVHAPIPKNFFFCSREELKKLLKKIKYPCVLKAHLSTLSHKSEFGGVVTNIYNQQELLNHYDALYSKLKRKKLLQFLEEFEVQEHITGSIELIIGALRDSTFGPVVLFGAGGKLVELLKDKNFALAPLSIEKAKNLIISSKTYPLLSGYRDIEKINLDTLAEILSRISELIYEFPQIEEIDLNPLIVSKKIYAVDYRLRVR